MPLGMSKWGSGLETKLNKGEFISIRSIRVEENARASQRPSQSLPEFLRGRRFSAEGMISDGVLNPLTTVRGGTIVIDRGEAIVIYPCYFIQRRAD